MNNDLAADIRLLFVVSSHPMVLALSLVFLTTCFDASSRHCWYQQQLMNRCLADSVLLHPSRHSSSLIFPLCLSVSIVHPPPSTNSKWARHDSQHISEFFYFYSNCFLSKLIRFQDVANTSQSLTQKLSYLILLVLSVSFHFGRALPFVLMSPKTPSPLDSIWLPKVPFSLV